MNRLRPLALAALALLAASADAAPTACAAGQAAGHGCHRIDLESRLTTDQLGYGDTNDIWGWTDPVGGREYAIVGAVGGTVFVDVTDPANPRVVGRLPAHEDIVAPAKPGAAAAKMCKAGDGAALPGPRPLHEECGAGGSIWRSVRAYRDHAYVGSEADGHGIQVFDLTQLRAFPPGSPVQLFDETAHYAGVGSSHTIFIDERSGFLYAVGSTTFAGGLHIVDLADPAAPVPAGGYAGDGYTHEVYCDLYAGPDLAHAGKQICIASNEDTLTILDVTDKGAIVQLSRTGYAGSAYTHQGWLTADQRYMFVNDELDEIAGGDRTRTLVWDLADLEAPQLVDQLHQPRFVIDHNEFVHQGFVYQSNYAAGLVILDGRDPLHAFEVAHFDTHPADDAAEFHGTWSNYPFFASGVVVVSDITRGLYVLRPRLGGAAEDASVTDMSAQIELLTGNPWFRVEPGAAGGVFSASIGPGARIAEFSVDDPATATGCALRDAARVLRCQALGAAPFEVRLTLASSSANPMTVELVAMVAGGGDETFAADNRASTSAIAQPADTGIGGGGGGGGGAVDLFLLLTLCGAAARHARRSTPA